MVRQQGFYGLKECPTARGVEDIDRLQLRPLVLDPAPTLLTDTCTITMAYKAGFWWAEVCLATTSYQHQPAFLSPFQ
jgi:hypothetical protein